MPAELLILRHAKSDWQHDCSDFDRPLNSRGLRDAPRMGAWLKSASFPPDAILCSPARRAQQTLEAVCKHADIPATAVRWEQGLYLASLEQLLDILHTTPVTTRRLMLIGHNPGLEDLLIHLSRTAPPRKTNGKLLTTAALAHLRLESDWNSLAQGCAQLLQLQYPTDLGD